MTWSDHASGWMVELEDVAGALVTEGFEERCREITSAVTARMVRRP